MTTRNDLYNQVTLTGNLTANAKHHENEKGNRLTLFTVVTKESYLQEDGTWKEESHFHPIKLRGKSNSKSPKLEKGDRVTVLGKLISGETYTDSDGVEQKTTYVRAEAIENHSLFLVKSKANKPELEAA